MEANPQWFLFVVNLQDLSVSTPREGGTTEETHHGEVFWTLCNIQSLRAGNEEGNHDDDEGERCSGWYWFCVVGEVR